MFVPLILHVDPQVDGRWRVALHAPNLRPTWAALSAEAVIALKSAVESAFAPEQLPAMLPPGREAPFSRQEERAGRALAAVLHASVAMTTGLAEARVQARAANAPLALLVDAHGEAADLPWELIADAPQGVGLEAVGQAVVMRLATGFPAPPRQGSWGCVVRLADAGDAVVGALGRGITSAVASAGLALSDGQPRPLVRQVLFLSGHGEAEMAQLALSTSDGAVAPVAALAALGARISAELVVLAVCDGALSSQDPSSGLVSLLSQAGAPAVLAPVGRVCAAATATLCQALVHALGAGQPLVAAIAEARRALRARAFTLPEARWYRWTLHITDLGLLSDAPRVGGELRAQLGWPEMASDTEDWLRRGLALATEMRCGYFGVEHMALALADMPPSLAVFLWRGQILSARDRILTAVTGYVPLPDRPLTISPRMQQLGAALQPGASVNHVGEQLRQAPLWGALLNLRMRPAAPVRDGATEPDAPTGHEATDGAAPKDQPWLEVLGGPEDGRLFRPVPGDILGRDSVGTHATLRLYKATGAYDAMLSREHLTFESTRTVRARKAVFRTQHGALEQVPPGLLSLSKGDLLRLTEHTHLFVSGEPV